MLPAATLGGAIAGILAVAAVMAHMAIDTMFRLFAG
jgi:hypothetical protein